MNNRGGDRVAAGGLLWRGHTAPVEVAVVHRDRYDDWSFPKGGVEPGEHVLTAAAREVAEETGADVGLSRSLGRTRHAAAGGWTTVHWWVARCLAVDVAARDEEVDELRWLEPANALELLSYPGDRELLADCAARPLADATVILVRHANAGDRRAWKGPDDARPLDAAGKQQAALIAAVMPALRPDRLLSADPLRCRQTAEPLASALGLPVEVSPVWGDEAFERSPEESTRALIGLAAEPGSCAALCSQGNAIPGMLSQLAAAATFPAAARDIRRASRKVGGHWVPRSRKGSAWVLSFSAGSLVAADYLPDLRPAK